MVDSPGDFPTTSDIPSTRLPGGLDVAPIIDEVDQSRLVQDVGKGKIQPIDNVLNQFDSYTYKWTLYLADPKLHNNPNSDNTFRDGTVIAESGNAGRFFIDSVNIENLVSINSTTRNMPFTKFTFTIIEPKGINFMDSLLRSVKHLNIPNHIKAPYYLQLEFWAWNRDGVQVIVPEATRKWSIQIFDMKTNVKADGSTYVFDAIATDDIGTMNYTSITQFSIAVRDATTIGDFFAQYERTMNEFYDLYRGILYQHADKISFTVSDAIKDLKFGGGVLDPKRGASATSTNDDEKTLTIPKGFDIITIVENLMINTPEWESKIQMPVTDERTKVRDDFTILWSIETEVEYLEYDIRRQDYARHYTFNIKPITLLRSAGDVDRGDIQFQEGRFNKLVETFEIKKLYHYIFTGLNTEVLNFELDLSMMWYNEMPLHIGTNTHSQGDAGRMIKADGVDTLPRQRSIVLKDLLSAAQVSRQVDEDLRLNQLGTDGSGDAAVAESIFASSQVKTLKKEFENLPNATVVGTVAESDRLADRINASRGTTTNPRFIEDIDRINTSNSFNLSDTPQVNSGAVVYSLRYDPTREDLTKMFGTEGDRTSTKAFMAAYLNYFVNAEMFNLDLEIRGDPWWIQRGKFERRSLGVTLVPEQDIGDNTAMDSTFRDNLLILNMRSPRPENPDGFYETEDNDLYTGIYQIIKVESNFEGGMFTQKLSGVKDALTDLRILRTKI